jgi:hypothetical protein
MGFSDTFAVIGVKLAIAAVRCLLARKAKIGAAFTDRHWRVRIGSQCAQGARKSVAEGAPILDSLFVLLLNL